MPEQVAVALRPPRSVAAVPAISEVMPTAAVVISTPARPTMNGEECSEKAMTTAITSAKMQNRPVGGPRRDWKNLSETNPPAKPPTMPKKQSSSPQCATKNSAPSCLNSLP